jgi:type II secretory pathway component HofQ
MLPIRCLPILLLAAPMVMGAEDPIPVSVKQAGAPDQHPPVKAPPDELPQPMPAPHLPVVPGEPLFTMEVYHQDAEEVIWAFAKKANIRVILLDRSPLLISFYFTNLPVEEAFREILRAADLDFVKTEHGYVVGLAIDLKLRFPNPEDKVIEATYRCRRIGADTLVKTIEKAFGETSEFRASIGPEFLTPAVEDASTVGGEDARDARVLKVSNPEYRTHDVVFSGPPDMVRRALSLARKFDRPRKQVRVNVRVVQMTSNASRNLGVAWMQSLNLSANELPTASLSGDTSTGSTSLPQGAGLSLGKFTHSVISVNATLNALEQSGESRTLANPTLLVLDGEKSFILSGTKYVLPEISLKDPSGQASYSTTTVKLGLYLQVGVQVGLDDDMVLTIYPQVSTLSSFTTINTIQYPVITTVEEQATVRAVKGDVIVLGGLKKEVTSDSKAGVPFLASLPLIGKLFSNDLKQKTTEELMFVLTPEIIEDKEPTLDMKMSVQPAPGQPVS